MKQLNSPKKGWVLMLAVALTATFAGASYAADSGDQPSVVAKPSALPVQSPAATVTEPSSLKDQPEDIVDMPSVLGDFQCDSMTVDVTTVTTTTTSVLNDAGDGWDQVTSTEKSTTSNELTAEEQATCAPSAQDS